MLELFKRYGVKEQKGFLMPRGLRYIKALAEAGIDWRGLHMIDAVSLYCALKIEDAKNYLRARAQERMLRAGVRRISPATEAEFDAL